MRRSLAVAVILTAGLRLGAQGVVTRVAILTAEDRRAPTPRDLSTLRSGLHNRRDPELTRMAVRALGRLERPELIPEIEPLLRSELPEVRAEAANAVAQAAQGWKHPPEKKTPAVRQTGGAAGVSGVERASGELISRLHIETEPAVRGALCQAIGRMPYATADQVQQAESALTEALAREDSTDGRLGVAQGFESLLRLHHDLSPPSATTVASLTDLASGSGINGAARVRRLALEGLIAADALSDAVIQRAASDSDAQVRRQAMRAAAVTRRFDDDRAREILRKGETDPSTLVRFEALRGDGDRTKGGEQFCAAVVAATGDTDPHVALLALDQLSACSTSSDAVAVLERTLDDLPSAGAERGWHRAAHALVALASAQPDRAKQRLAPLMASRVWQLRMYAARAAATLHDRPALEKLAADENDNVCEAALAALSRLAGHDADSLFIAGLGRSGYQAVREAARSLAGTPKPDEAVASLKGALDRLTREGRDNSRDARSAIIAALESLGAHVDRLKPVRDLPVTSEFSGDELRRLGSARARVTIKSVGAFELALFTAEAPATVLRFAGLAQSGYYNGLTFHRVVPNFVIQGGSPGANEYVGDASYMRDEVGLWPHVRGAVGISTRGRDTGDAQIFVDLIDNPRLDHDYTVFAQVLSGMEVVDRILEGDVIEKIEIVTQ